MIARLRHRVGLERRIPLLALLGALPGTALLLVSAFRPLPAPWAAGGALFAFAAALLAARAALRQVRRPLETLANLLGAIREGDFSFRARTDTDPGSLGVVYGELNTLSRLLHEQRLGALEATALLRSVMEAIEVALFAFDDSGACRLVNRAGEALLARPAPRILGETAQALGLGDALTGPLLLDLSLPGRTGRFELRRTTVRQGGRPHLLLALSDLTRALREEERQAWQRLLRVLGHEINNSLAPIQSLAQAVSTALERDPGLREPDWEADARTGLGIVASRAQSLGRFVDATTRVARLPEPRRRPVDLRAVLAKVAALETRLAVRVDDTDGTFSADADQLEQALINLVRNAADAALSTGGGVRLSGRVSSHVELRVDDDGPGLPPSANLFVPFFTTKPGGSGIGLLLARQVAEGHGGSLLLRNRTDGAGAVALLRLPLDEERGSEVPGATRNSESVPGDAGTTVR